MSEIDVKNVEKSFGDLKVLNGISFDVKKGEILAVLGPSGCGKSTLIKIISGLIEQDSGTVDTNNKSTGIVFQNPRLLKWRTVEQNITLGLEMKGMDKDPSRIKQMLEMIELSDFKDVYPNQLSGGMKQRVSLARTLAIDPEILLVDEPFSSLDLNTRTNLQDKFLDIHKKMEKTTVFITHSTQEAIKMGDRIIVLSEKPTNIKNIFNSTDGNLGKKVKSELNHK